MYIYIYTYICMYIYIYIYIALYPWGASGPAAAGGARPVRRAVPGARAAFDGSSYIYIYIYIYPKGARLVLS